MGYTIDYNGEFKLNKPLRETHATFLRDFAKTRHYHRVWKDEEQNGWMFVDPDEDLEPDLSNEDFKKVLYAIPYDHYARKSYELEHWSCVDWNEVNPGMPSFYCQWIPNEFNNGIEWDGGEKFYKAKEWLELMIEHFFKPWGYVLNGEVEIENGESEYGFNFGYLIVEDNVVRIVSGDNEDDYPGDFEYEGIEDYE